MRSLTRFAVPAAVALAVPLVAAPLGGPSCNALPSVGNVGTGSAGAFGTPLLEGLGTPDIATPSSFSFRVSGGVPQAPGILLLQRREIPITSNVYQTTLYTGSGGVAVPFVLDGAGVALIDPHPTASPIQALCGMDLIAQAVVFDFTAPGGGAWSQGLRFRFGTAP